MKFLTPSEKIKETRKFLKMKQEDLQDENVSRGLISMIETDQRALAKNVAIKLAEKFKQKAKELDIKFEIDENFLLRSPAEDAELYCLKKLEGSIINEEIIEIACKFNLLEIKASFYSKKGDFYLARKDYDNAFINYNNSMSIYNDNKQHEIIPHLYFQMGICKARDYKYNDALSYFDICERYSVMYKDTKTQKLVLYDIALCYKKIDKFELALKTIQKYLLFSNKKDNFYFYANFLKSNCYKAICKYDIAIEIYNSLLAELPKPEDPLLGYIYNNLGVLYLDKADFKTSLECFERAEKIRNAVDKNNLCHTLIDKSKVFFSQHFYVEAIKIINLGLISAETYKDYEYLLKGNYSLLRIYESIDDISNLKKVYLVIADLLKDNNNFSELTLLYTKLSLIYLNENDIEKAKECLILSQKLYE
ncbi:helix-turn-helix transcriptional regulator [Clostridium tagluense]|uniref:helix-turn-helix transcriptional regulator n=1 Tax=Clostridium tagluense TaxID=360422 RepID=UPI001CF4F1D0|nr:helix-turn-helix transcriptional regulator [Clostridium tagluense]MCB2311967.1 helix-turn-helix transcriptional regulator [Clostridium tagluense]MCB2318122.1 helix-turn-helix transcriptional regulator [Clostridium tagluense]MCB2323341.1 helix-turn-helix transcriptional regulator [Clostridium tagluense]MCB2327906.1 helix-turn-helix transcriptional regulator [Clostridium tagluense]MCB2333104.1 helix-turn-helix transcriptional regulator [Clostridium tagluense]